MTAFLQIEPTTRCNYTCGFCAGRHMAQRDLDFELFRQVIDHHPDLMHLELQGEGEPLMHPRFFDMVDYARRRSPGLRVSLITNGSLFNRRNVDGLVTHGIHKLYVSAESARPERFQAIRGGSLERVRRGIESLLAERRRRGAAHPVVGLAVTVLRSTADQIDELVDFYEDTGMDGGVTLQFLQDSAAYTGHYDAAMTAEILGGAEKRRFIEFCTASPRRVAAIREHSRRVGFYEALMAGSHTGPPTCNWLERGLYVAADGTACSCCFIKDGARFGLGRIGEVTPQELTGKRVAMLQELKSGRTPPACTGCPTAARVTGHFHAMRSATLAASNDK